MQGTKERGKTYYAVIYNTYFDWCDSISCFKERRGGDHRTMEHCVFTKALRLDGDVGQLNIVVP